MSASKRPRLHGEFTPTYNPSSSSPVSGSGPTMAISQDTTMVDEVSQAKLDSEHIKKSEEDEIFVDAGESGFFSGDVDMVDDVAPSIPDWHLAESTAHSEAVSRYINSDKSSPYLLRSTTRVRGRPHPSRDFVQMFNLQDIATSVRRVDPSTGEKINKIRKSYEGKVKELKVAGRNKAISSPGEWVPNLTAIPDDDWMGTMVLGKEISKSTSVDFQSKLTRALDILPGTLPKNELARWKNILAVDEMPSIPQSMAMGKASRPGMPGTSSTATMDHRPMPSITATTPTGADRPDRANKKRKYTDESFAGYEVFADEDGATDEESAKKKRKKGYPVSPMAPYSMGIAAGDN